MEFNASLKDHFIKLLAYDQWANGLLLKDMEALPTPDPIALARMSHILTAEDIWLTRLEGRDSLGFTTTWVDRSLAECREKLSELAKRWTDYLSRLEDKEFGRIVSYKNTKGQAYQMAAGGILTQVFDHGSYHRGQIATAIKKGGGEPHSPGFYGFVLDQENK